jgi:Na+/H+-dicarboxylate symporter
VKPSALASQAVQGALGLAAGFGLGLVLSHGVVSPTAVTRLLSIVEPIGTAWINAVRMTVIPLIVPLLIVGVAGGDDTRRVGVIGARAFAWFLAMLVVIATCSALISPWLFDGLSLDPTATARLRATTRFEVPTGDALSLRTWALGLIPLNPIRAAADGALLPVVLFTLLYAFALTRVAPALRATQVAFFRGMADAMLVLVRWILALGWLGIFCLAVVLGEKLGAAALGAIAYYIVVLVAMNLTATIGVYALIVLSRRVPFMRFVRAALPAQVVAIGSRSSLAALPALVSGATDTLRLPATATGFVLPLAVSVFKLNAAVYWVPSALFVGVLYGVPLTPTTVMIIAASSVALSFSTPGVPSGGMLLQAPLYAAIGLPVEGIGILIALDTIPDMAKTLLNVTSDLAVAVMTTEASTEAAASPS